MTQRNETSFIIKTKNKAYKQTKVKLSEKKGVYNLRTVYSSKIA